jgi:hypothetical protein
MVALGNFLFRFRTTLSPFLPLLLLLPGPVVLADPFVAALIGFAVALVVKSFAAARSVSSTSFAAGEITACTPTRS